MLPDDGVYRQRSVKLQLLRTKPLSVAQRNKHRSRLVPEPPNPHPEEDGSETQQHGRLRQHPRVIVKGQFLRHHADGPADSHRVAGHRMAGDDRIPARGRVEGGEHRDGGRLARAVCPAG